jgi:hypothetical protein
MKKIYQKPTTDSSVGYFNPLCDIGIVGSTEATEGNLIKEREEAEEDAAIIQLLKDREEGNTSSLW